MTHAASLLVDDLWLVQCDRVVLVFDRDFVETYVAAINAERASGRHRAMMCETCDAAHRDGQPGRYPRPAHWRVSSYGELPMFVCNDCARPDDERRYERIS